MFKKADDVELDFFDGDLILMSLSTRRIVILNRGGHVLWEALDHLPRRAELIETVAEAFPDAGVDAARESVESILTALLAARLITESAEPA
jgi:hypothetical protein